MAANKRLPLRAYLRGIFHAAMMSMRIAPREVTIKLFGAILTAVLPLVTAYLAAQTTSELAAAYNGTAGAGNRALYYVVATTIVGIISFAWTTVDGYIQSLLRYKVTARISDMMYEKLLSLPFWRYEDKDTIDTYDKAQRFARFYAYVFDQLASLFSDIVGVISAIIGLALFMPWLALAVLVSLVPGIIIRFKTSRQQIDLWSKNVQARRAQNEIEWMLTRPAYIIELRITSTIRHLLNLRNRYREQDELQRMNIEKRYIGWQLLSNIVESATEFASLLWVTLAIIRHEQPLGQFIFVQQLVSRAMASASSLVNSINMMDEDIAQLFEYQKFMEYETEKPSAVTLHRQPDLIDISNVTFRYFGSSTDVLRDISLRIHRGQHVAIVGENGAGKSTLIKLLLGLFAPTKGHITIDGVDLQDIEPHSWHRQLGILQQDYIQYDFTTIKDNVHFGDITHPFDQRRYKTAIGDAEAAEYIKKLPHKDKSYISKWIVEDDDNEDLGIKLSGGQMQRLALARGFYRAAPIIILDEPTSAIDALAEARIFRRLLERKDKTIITISHRLSTVRRADVIYVLEHGKLVEQGTHTDLVARKGVYYRLFESQL